MCFRRNDNGLRRVVPMDDFRHIGEVARTVVNGLQIVSPTATRNGRRTRRNRE